MPDVVKSSRGVARWVILAAIVIAAVVGGIFLLGRGHESTDDAQVEGRITQISTRVGGPIARVEVRDNQYVEAGTLLAAIDPREYEVAVAKAQAELADAQATAQAEGSGVPIAAASTSSDVRTASSSVDEARAGIAVAEKQVDAARAQVVAMEARVRERQAMAVKAERDVERLAPLVAKKESRSSNTMRPSPRRTPRGLPPKPRSPTPPRRRWAWPWPSSACCRPGPPTRGRRPSCSRRAPRPSSCRPRARAPRPPTRG